MTLKLTRAGDTVSSNKNDVVSSFLSQVGAVKMDQK